ncbi:MAG: selenium metabolism-associated LysR family transcriptional regulator [Syntrophorhabdaceae bacterium]|nr:selenium metabolism-associated LysR family transcriptional regulator [Syntrophorhabdaceae bacterium]
MDIKHLETFLKIASLRSFTKAAEELFLTQPTISKQLSDLEKSLGVKLIDRTKRSVSLTKAGEILMRYAKDLQHLKREIIEEISAYKGLEKGSITVGASNIPGVYIIPQIFSLFREKFNNIYMRLIISDSREITAKMFEGEYDIGFVGAKDDTAKLEYRVFLEDQIVVIAPRDYPDTIDVAGLYTYPLISRENGSGTRNHFERVIKSLHKSKDAAFKVIAEMSDTESIKNAVKNGLGISYISRMAIKDELGQGTIKILNIKNMPVIKRSFYMVTRKGRTISPHVKAFIEIVRQWSMSNTA